MYDIIVLGAGPGGYVAAIKGAQLGAKVLLIEKEKVGGICLNHGCIPTKTLLKSAKVYKTVLEASTFGVEIDGKAKVNLTKMMARKNKVVSQLTNGISYLLKKNKVDVVNGYGEVKSAHEVVVDNKSIQRRNLLLRPEHQLLFPQLKG
ncbi:MAG: FAD-dependent oxidoreductase [Bacilli bacterium]